MVQSVNETLLIRLKAAGLSFTIDKNLSEMTTFCIGGPCPVCVDCQDEESVKKADAIFRSLGIRAFVIGEGSNLLVSDKGIPLPVIHFLTKGCKIAQESPEIISVSAGTPLDVFAEMMVKKEIENFIFLTGIPGAVGGAVVGNAGAFGRQIGDHIVWADVISQDGRQKRMRADQMNFGYRESIFKHQDGHMILRVGLRILHGNKEALEDEREQILTMRRQKHPDYKKIATAGSFFKNVVTDDGKRLAAGRFLDEAGCKTLSVGGAAVFKKHANIVINKKNASCEEVITLAKLMREQVKEKFQIELEPEVRFLGEVF